MVWNPLRRCFRARRIALFLAAAGLTASCETTKGFGRDVENAGEAVTDTAEEADEE